MKRIRIVEDNETIAKFVCEALLKTDKFDILLTPSGFSALLCPEPWLDIDIALVDMMLPEITGHDILAYLTIRHPEIIRFGMTASLQEAENARPLCRTVFVKPFDISHLVEQLSLYGD